MIDKRQSRRVHREAFAAAILAWRARQAEAPRRAPLETLAPLAAPPAPPRGAAARRVRVLARKRPFFAHEEAKGEFDCVSVPTAGRVVVHHAVMHADLRRMIIVHNDFGGNAIEAFSEADDTGAVCERGVGPLIEHVKQGGCSTVFMYGQTGSGKTFTMRGIEEAASLLMPAQPDAFAGLLSVVEIAGGRTFDLLAADKPEVRPQPPHPLVHSCTTPLRAFAHTCHPLAIPSPPPRHPLATPFQVRLQQDASGKCCMLGAASEPLSCAADFLAVVEQAKARRATQSTGANAESSRSHAVIRLTVGSATGSPPRGGGGGGGGVARPAVLTLVDCAGTERKEDSATHSAERRKEGAEINTSLHALKECLRHWLLAREGNKARRPSAEAQHTSPTLATTPEPNPDLDPNHGPGPSPAPRARPWPRPRAGAHPLPALGAHACARRVLRA